MNFNLIFPLLAIIFAAIIYFIKKSSIFQSNPINENIEDELNKSFIIEDDDSHHDKHLIIQNYLMILRNESSNFLISQFKIVVTGCLIISTILFIIKANSETIFIIIFFMYGILISFIIAYVTCMIALDECKQVLSHSRSKIETITKIIISSCNKITFIISTLIFISIYLLILFISIKSIDISFYIQELCGFGLGCSFTALFCRIGGGIFTKGCDISCDIIGKIESDLRENDERNPSSVGDTLGDLVGDLVGTVLDLNASFAETFSAVFFILSFSGNKSASELKMIMFIFNLFISCFLIFVVISFLFDFKVKDKLVLQKDNQIDLFLINHMTFSTIFTSIYLFFYCYYFFPEDIILENFRIGWIKFFCLNLLGLISGYLICLITYNYTSKSSEYVKYLAKKTEVSSSINIILGLALGSLSTILPILIISATVLISDIFCGIYGIAFSTFGVILNLAFIIQIGVFGPLSDTCLGVLNIINNDYEASQKVNILDEAGNTLSAIVKGYSTGCGGLVSFGLYGAVMMNLNITIINLQSINLIFLMFGSLFTYAIKGLCMLSTADNAEILLRESRKQRENSKVLNKKIRPDYYELIQNSSEFSFKRMFYIGMTCITPPLIIHYLFGAEPLISLLTGIIITGMPISISFSNSGSIWDNSKKILEGYDKNHNFHSRSSQINAIIGDNVGDTFKDITGPVISVLMKFSSIFALVITNASKIQV